MRFANLAVAQQFAQMFRYFRLTGVWARIVNALIERDRSSLQSFQRHRARDVSQASDAFSSMKSQPSDGRHRLSSVQQRQAFFDVELQRPNSGSPQSVCARQPFVFVKGFAFADHCEREVRERREVPAGPNRSLLGNYRCDTAVQHLDQSLDEDRATATVTEREHV